MTEADIVIVGGGPIGYAQAMGFKKLNPGLKIVVLEKYPEFKRKHTLVMQPKQLKKLIDAIDAQDDPDLKQLLVTLRKNPHIRTNALQEKFKKIAEAAGVETVITTVEEKDKEGKPVEGKTIDELVLGYKPKLIVGADGTHSVINEKLFPKNNQISHEVDFAMQIRYEIEGDADSEESWKKRIEFYQDLARRGLVATPQIGRPDPKTGKTPITVQLIIPKEDYQALTKLKASAGTPLVPFADNLENDEERTKETQRFNKVPKHLRSFITNHIESVIKTSENPIDRNSIRISVNELPASRAKQVFTEYKGAYVSLNGDAGLGLSYFKGLNSGLEALAQYFKKMKSSIEGNLNDKELLGRNLSEYQDWFSPYADRKIEEVKQYSNIKVKPARKVFKFVELVKGFSRYEPKETDKDKIINAYFRLIANADSNDQIEYNFYRHRDYNPEIMLGQFSYVPLQYSLKKMGKIFIDFFKPYKGTYQLANDFKQPLSGIVNVFSGLVKIVTGIFTLSPFRFLDGVLSLTRGALEIIITPLSWTIKPILRGLITLGMNKQHLTEENRGIQKLVAQGEKALEHRNEESSETTSYSQMQYMLGICHDLHRKFDKSTKRGQKTDIPMNDEGVSEEQVRYDKIIPQKSKAPISFEAAQEYISLFAGKKIDILQSTDSNEIEPVKESVI
jgi:2-polyprenyl-6-methoxyphenol hydroxylase-like FAD-dependent oxidoreductase